MSSTRSVPADDMSHVPPSSTHEITYRTIQPGDVQAVRDLYEMVQVSNASEIGDPAVVAHVRAHIDRVFAEDLADPIAHYTKPGQRYWLAHAGQELVGMAGIERWPGEDGVARLRHVMVGPGWRRKGIASTILDIAERWCAEEGYRAIRLGTSSVHSVAIGIYRRRGYAELERSQDGAVVDYTMEKTLSGQAG